MRKTMWVAVREFLSTVMTKSFIFGVFFPPAIITLLLLVMPALMNQAAPSITGRVAIIDQSGAVAGRLAEAFTPEAVQARRNDRFKRGVQQAPVKVEMDPATEQMAEAMAGAATLSLEPLPADTDPEAAKGPILEAEGKERDAAANPRLALAVIPPGAVVPPEGGEFAPFDLFVAAKLDPEIQEDIRDQVARAIVDARVEAVGLETAHIRRLIDRPRTEVKVVTSEGERASNEVAAIMIPMGFMFLLWISVFTGGQYLLNSTVEEKSSRVMEVLLSAVSPLQLMVGKILGQMAVAGVILLAYTLLGIGSLVAFRQDHLIEPLTFAYLVIFFVIAFFLIAALMAAIGSAVNDMREAGALLGPVMIILVIPMMLWFPISRNPNSTFALVCSFIPPINPFIMVLRLAGSEKVPAWQVPLSIAVGLLAVVFAAWAAAKVFRIGVLMYGKPPNLATLIRWIRMA